MVCSSVSWGRGCFKPLPRSVISKSKGEKKQPEINIDFHQHKFKGNRCGTMTCTDFFCAHNWDCFFFCCCCFFSLTNYQYAHWPRISILRGARVHSSQLLDFTELTSTLLQRLINIDLHFNRMLIFRAGEMAVYGWQLDDKFPYSHASMECILREW